MPPQSRAAQGFAGVAVEIDLILKGIKTMVAMSPANSEMSTVEIDLILKGIKTVETVIRFIVKDGTCGNRPDSQRD